jgi:hypothetical protein
MAVSQAFLGTLILSSLALAEHLTGTYPPPLDLSSNDSFVTAAWQNFTDTFDAYLNAGKTEGVVLESLAAAEVENLTFSIGLWSLHDPVADQLQYHYASPATVNNPNGTNKVDADSIYKAASVSKLVTVLSGLLSMTHEQWNTPLSEIYPTLAQQASSANEDAIIAVQWDQVTPWSIAQ